MDLQRQQEERDKIQTQAEELSLNHKHLLLQWATGVGKGKAVMQCIAASLSTKKWLIVVPEIIQIANYKADMEKHGYSWLLGSKVLDVICYASLKLYKHDQLNLALNEVHRVSDLREEIVKSIDYDQIISDSATLSDQMQQKLWNICPYYDFEITLDEAIRRGLLPAPTIYTIPIRLNNKEKRNKIKIGGIYKLLTDYQAYRHYNGSYEFWKDKYEDEENGGKIWQKNKMLQAASKRKEFVAHCKTRRAQTLLFSLRGKRVVCFTGSVWQCETLGGKSAVYGDKGKTHNLSTIEKFNAGEIDELYFYKMGKEGMNLNRIEVGVIVQLDSGNDDGLSFLQRTGRALRALEPDIYIFYAEDTQDEKYLERALQNIDKQYVKKYELI